MTPEPIDWHKNGAHIPCPICFLWLLAILIALFLFGVGFVTAIEWTGLPPKPSTNPAIQNK